MICILMTTVVKIFFTNLKLQNLMHDLMHESVIQTGLMNYKYTLMNKGKSLQLKFILYITKHISMFYFTIYKI